jgi:hypothetical protein
MSENGAKSQKQNEFIVRTPNNALLAGMAGFG